jgi:hypothetical protein
VVNYPWLCLTWEERGRNLLAQVMKLLILLITRIRSERVKEKKMILLFFLFLFECLQKVHDENGNFIEMIFVSAVSNKKKRSERRNNVSSSKCFR